MTRETDEIKKKYPPGTRLKLIFMDDPYSPVPPETTGTVNHVDDAGQIHIDWDNGRTLPLVLGADSFRVLEEYQKENIVEFGDECKVIIPNEPIDCSSLGFFDDLEQDCWELVKQYCGVLGVKIVPDEDGNVPISYDIAKDIQDSILGKIQETGVELHFGEIREGEENSPELEM